MDTCKNKQAPSIVEFEQKAQELRSIMFALCEKRLLTEKFPPSAHGKALAATALVVQESIKAFLAVERTL